MNLKKMIHLNRYLFLNHKVSFSLRMLYKAKIKPVNLFILMVYMQFLNKRKSKKTFFYSVTKKIANQIFLNLKIIKLWLIYNDIKVLNLCFKFNPLKNKQKNYVVLRSPHVHKTSREHFFFNVSSSTINITLITNTFITYF
jgi:hypothetical protein